MAASTPTYVVKKIGDEFVTLPKHPAASGSGCLWCGVAMVALGAIRRGVGGVLLTAVGANLLTRAATGRNLFGIIAGPHRRIGGPNSADLRQSPTFRHDDSHPARQAPADAVDEASMESFPASDPPARTTPAARGAGESPVTPQA